MDKTTDANTLREEITSQVYVLAHLTSDAGKSEAMKQYLESCARFHQYSLNNQWLISLARPDATQIAGFNTWKRFNRWVKKGEKGIPILAPCLCRVDPDAEESPHVLKGFRVVYVFDVSQTMGEDLPVTPNWKSPDRNEELQTKLIDFALSKGISVAMSELNSGAQGASSGGHIELSVSAGTKTLIHEIAHELMHHGLDRHDISRQVREVEAEAVAFVIATHFQIADLASPNYLALWEADESQIVDRMDRIRIIAIDIINAVESQTVLPID